MSLDDYWANQDRALDRIIAEGKTAADVIRILNEHFTPSSGVAFFPGGGNRDLLGTLDDTPGWRTVWVEASYYFAARDSAGNGITFVEGDVYEGVQRPPT